MPCTTQVINFPLTADSNVSDAASAAAAEWKKVNETVAQQPGFQQMSSGPHIENKDMLETFVGKSSLPLGSFLETNLPATLLTVVFGINRLG